MKPRRGDIVFTRETPAGQAGIINSDEAVFLGQRTMHFRPNPKKVKPSYLLYELMGSGIKQQIDKLISGSTVGHLSVPECKKFMLRVPPLEKQIEFEEKRDRVLRLIDGMEKAKNLPLLNALSQKGFSESILASNTLGSGKT